MRIYGPVPSWRLGNSLGVDLVEAPKGYGKICSFDCLYCQLGHNGMQTHQAIQIPVLEADFELLRKKIIETKPDYITFSGQGEPTLNLNLGFVAKRIKQMTNIPISVLTNASLIGNSKVRTGLDYCDLVIAKLDAPTQDLFEKINQPYEDHPFGGILLKNIIQGIKLIKAKVAIQTLLFSYDRLTNADDKTIGKLIGVYRDINNSKPINIFLGTAYRPSDKQGIKPISEERLKEIALKINEETSIEVIYYKESQPRTISRQITPSKLESEIIELLRRRPCTKEDLSTRFGGVDVSGVLAALKDKGTLLERKTNEKRFYFIEND